MLCGIVSLGQKRAVLELIEKSGQGRFNPNEPDDDGNIPIIIAASRNDLSMMKILFNHGAKLNLMDSYGHTALEFAKHYNNLQMITFIEQNSN